jgi:hypothetical protein
MTDPVENVHHGGVLNRAARESILNGLLAARLCNSPMRVRAFRQLGITVGENTRIESDFFGGLPGVVIGPGCVIAAGAVVVSDCKPNGLYAGVPARRLRDL